MTLSNNQIDEIFTLLSLHRPHPAIELEYINPYTLTIAVILSAQSTDKGVNKITPALFALANSPTKMLELGVDGLKQHIKSLGLYNNKAANIMAMSRALLERFNGNVPSTLDDLISLPGIGRKSANVILNCIFHQPTIAVDTHVFRVANRIGICDAKNVLETEKQLMARVPMQWLQRAHHWLVLHGRYICKARRPECQTCILNKICEYYAGGE